MLKIIFGLIAVGISTAVGHGATSKFSKRLSFFTALSDFNSALLRDTAYKKDGVTAILRSHFGDETFNIYAKSVLCALLSDCDIANPPDFLDENDRFSINEYFKTGCLLVESAETDYLTMKREEFKEKLIDMKEKSKKLTSLGSKLGFALGSVIFILII